jgi:8-oxo-dGTP pyrophosphatase MutT (NUDIX family)
VTKTREQPWESLSLEAIQEKPYPLVRERLRTPEGKELVYVYMPGQQVWVSVLPITAAATVLMVHQYRHVWGRWTYDLPGGVGEAGEPPEVSARRELLEETGAQVEELIALPTQRMLGSMVAAKGHSFIGLGSKVVQPLNPDDGELLEVVELKLGEVYELLESDSDFDAAATITLLRARPTLLARGLLK